MVFWVGHIYDPVEVVLQDCRFPFFFETNKGVEGERFFFKWPLFETVKSLKRLVRLVKKLPSNYF